MDIAPYLWIQEKKVVSPDSVCVQKLTTFSDLYSEATPDERRERLRTNRLIPDPDEIKLALVYRVSFT